MQHKAQCQCGQLTVEMTTDPDFVLVCNCTQCQRRTGSAFTYAAFFKRDTVGVSGSYKDWTRDTATGNKLTNHFCPDCGTNVFWSPELRPDYHGVAVGCLLTDVPDPTNAIFVSEKVDWLTFPESWRHFQRSVAEG